QEKTAEQAMLAVRVLVCGGIYNRWRLPWNNNLTIMHFFVGKQCLALFFIVVFAFIFFALQNNKLIELREQQVSPTNILTVTNGSKKQQGVCTFKPLSPKETEEERLILDSIAWPEIPPWPTPISIETTCDPAHSSFTILPRRGGGQWQIGDQLRVMIEMSDFNGRPKTSGGDFLLARLHNSKLQAGVVGKVVDHLNGSYSAVFSLVWEGDAVVE
ncbi:NXPE family member 3-like, partial [Notothenia coriiceps]|uniref:NXPE family member 3-like n=1 Tax=Notothenia coriiceps TaxID=8208 RepID=A0A6I9NQN5_9TELE